jgi:hypothetical protein
MEQGARHLNEATKLHSIKTIFNSTSAIGTSAISSITSTSYGASFINNKESFVFERYELQGINDRKIDELADGIVASCCVESDWYCYIFGVTNMETLLCWVYREGSCLVDRREICSIPMKTTAPAEPERARELLLGSILMRANVDLGILIVS